jgi:hypothetical protein
MKSAEWHRGVPGFFASLAATFLVVTVVVAADWPTGAAELLGPFHGIDLSLGWCVVLGLVLGVPFGVFSGLLTIVGGNWLGGLLFGGMTAASVGLGLRTGSAEDVAFGLAGLAGVIAGMLVIRKGVSAALRS